MARVKRANFSGAGFSSRSPSLHFHETPAKRKRLRLNFFALDEEVKIELIQICVLGNLLHNVGELTNNQPD